MDSWFGKLREKIVVDKVDEELDSDEERKRKENQLKDTLRKLNTDEVLNDDEITRVSELARRSEKEQSSKAEPGPAIDVTLSQAETLKSLQKPAQEEEERRAKPEDEAQTSPVVRIIEDAEHYESQFWD